MQDSAAKAAATPLTPEQLLERYLDGDDDAFRRLVERYEQKLYAFLVRMTGDAHLAEDVFQQAFIKVAKNAAAFDRRASFSTWLYRIARNAALDEIRRRARRADRPAGRDFRDGEEDAGRAAELADTSRRAPLEALADGEAAERIRDILATLPEAQREAFLLKEEGGLDFARIGVVLGCGRETAKSRFRLAVGKIRAEFGLDTGAGRKTPGQDGST